MLSVEHYNKDKRSTYVTPGFPVRVIETLCHRNSPIK